jgi:hypothetical protein
MGRQLPEPLSAPVLNAPFVDYAVRGQGEDTFVELLDVLDWNARSCHCRRAMLPAR